MQVDIISLFEPECGNRETEHVSAVLQSSQWPMGRWSAVFLSMNPATLLLKERYD